MTFFPTGFAPVAMGPQWGLFAAGSSQVVTRLPPVHGNLRTNEGFIRFYSTYRWLFDRCSLGEIEKVASEARTNAKVLMRRHIRIISGDDRPVFDRVVKQRNPRLLSMDDPVQAVCDSEGDSALFNWYADLVFELRKEYFGFGNLDDAVGRFLGPVFQALSDREMGGVTSYLVGQSVVRGSDLAQMSRAEKFWLSSYIRATWPGRFGDTSRVVSSSPPKGNLVRYARRPELPVSRQVPGESIPPPFPLEYPCIRGAEMGSWVILFHGDAGHLGQAQFNDDFLRGLFNHVEGVARGTHMSVPISHPIEIALLDPTEAHIQRVVDALLAAACFYGELTREKLPLFVGKRIRILVRRSTTGGAFRTDRIIEYAVEESDGKRAARRTHLLQNPTTANQR